MPAAGKRDIQFTMRAAPAATRRRIWRYSPTPAVPVDKIDLLPFSFAAGVRHVPLAVAPVHLAAVAYAPLPTNFHWSAAS
jgi:hypothetical protein